MAIFHRATITPTKEDLITAWAPSQRWGPSRGERIDVIGSYRFDDPDGQVGMETFIVEAEGALFQVPLTYRAAPLVGSETALVTGMKHSILGNRWVYDGLRDPLYVVMLTAVAMTGQGEALGMAVYDGRWYIAPTNVRITGGGWTEERVPVDRLKLIADERDGSLLRSDLFEVRVYRRPLPGDGGNMRLTATWPGLEKPVVLAHVTRR